MNQEPETRKHQLNPHAVDRLSLCATTVAMFSKPVRQRQERPPWWEARYLQWRASLPYQQKAHPPQQTQQTPPKQNKYSYFKISNNQEKTTN